MILGGDYRRRRYLTLTGPLLLLRAGVFCVDANKKRIKAAGREALSSFVQEVKGRDVTFTIGCFLSEHRH